jgi:hypothetical protein
MQKLSPMQCIAGTCPLIHMWLSLSIDTQVRTWPSIKNKLNPMIKEYTGRAVEQPITIWHSKTVITSN